MDNNGLAHTKWNCKYHMAYNILQLHHKIQNGRL